MNARDKGDDMQNSELIKRAQKGDNDAIDKLFGEYKKVVASQARKYYLVGGDLDDLIQEGMIGFLKAVNTFDDNKGEFLPYAIRLINNEIQNLIKKSNTQKESCFNTSVPLNNQGEIVLGDVEVQKAYASSPESEFIGRESFDDMLARARAKLSASENAVFQLYLAGYDNAEMARKLNKTYKSVDNALTRIKHKLKTLK